MPRPTRGKTTSKIVQEAREQRAQPTPAEKKLWDALRGRRLAGLKFRRQHPYGQFILDAFCVEHQLEVEVDGGIHADPATAEHDAARTEFLEARGIRVLRFSNEEVEHKFGDVLKRIAEASLTPQPLLLKRKSSLQEKGSRVDRDCFLPSPEAEKPASGEGEQG
jgi:very-short-patch-repair endonuclease